MGAAVEAKTTRVALGGRREGGCGPVRGGVCEGRRLQDSPSSVKSWAQRALCTPASGARSRELDEHGRGDSGTHQPISPYPSFTFGTRPRHGASSAASNPVHLRTLIATSLSMVIVHPQGVTALAQQSREVLEACPHGSSVSVVPWGEAETLAVEAKGFTKLVLSTTQGLNLPNLKSSC
ncbi:rCG21488, isoform CRA_a [Rattus norvegicus]|uniref:RCG21488, isoform CRA_a n=1 Tax=Rattus norvegicus TaxID=10116 RepID=A6J269_RAT|nr:rCG21488, isoform CRA_a [Rattus norvegicus]